METGVEGSLRWPHSKAANRLSRHSDPFRWPSSLLSAFKACPQQRSADPDSVAGALSDLRASPDKWRGATREGGGACGKRRSSALLLRPACLLMSQLCSGVMTEELGRAGGSRPVWCERDVCVLSQAARTADCVLRGEGGLSITDGLHGDELLHARLPAPSPWASPRGAASS